MLIAEDVVDAGNLVDRLLDRDLEGCCEDKYQGLRIVLSCRWWAHTWRKHGSARGLRVLVSVWLQLKAGCARWTLVLIQYSVSCA